MNSLEEDGSSRLREGEVKYNLHDPGIVDILDKLLHSCVHLWIAEISFMLLHVWSRNLVRLYKPKSTYCGHQ